MNGSHREAARDLFGIDLPIVLGPMAGGPSTPALAAAVSAAGGLGVLGEGYSPPEQIRRDVRAVRERTAKPVAVNLFVPERVEVTAADIEEAQRLLAPYRDELGLPPTIPARWAEDFEAQLAVVVEERVDVFTFTFGVLERRAVEELHVSGAIVGGTATTPSEAVALERSGVDFVVAQGAEAGGHRGSFLASAGDDLIGLAALVPQIEDAVALPVVAAGGVVDGRGVAAALVLGAAAVQIGTAFLLCPEAGTSAPYRAALKTARAEDTVVTNVFSGRRARGIVNRLATELAGRPLPPYPVMNALTREIRAAAAARGDPSLLSLWAGQGVGLLREMPAADLVGLLAEEMEAALAG